METDPVDNTASKMSQPEYYPMFSPGYGMVVTPEQQRKMHEAQDRMEREKEEKDKNKKPPKPPRRPNARIGRLVLGNI